MKKLTILTTIFLTVIIVASCNAKNPKDKFLDDMIGAYGGVENLKKLDTYTSKWDMDVKVRGTRGKATNFVEQVGRLRVELVYPNSSETRVINQKKGYKSYDNAPLEEVTGPQFDSMKLQLMRLYTPLTLKAKLDNIKLSDVGNLKALTLKEGSLTTIYYVNSETFRIELVVGRLKMGPREMEFRTEYSKFKLVEGVLMHHKENKFAAGMNTALLFLRQIKLNEEHADKLFNK
ncbi:MAG: hypothetical protein V3V95_00465 [Thermodesulfobacteriota bacterium]